MLRWWRLGAALLVLGTVWAGVRVGLLGQTARDDLSTYGQFTIALATAVIAAITWMIKRQGAAPTQRGTDLDRLADDLASAMHSQWTQAVVERRLFLHPLPIRWRRDTVEPVAGPVIDATSPGPFSPPRLPGVDRITPRQLGQGEHRMLHEIYGGLASGRLILHGGPGTGKSAAAILLLLDALRYRKRHEPADRARIPVPVLFTLQGWDPGTTHATDWIVTKLTEIPLLSRGNRSRAAALLEQGRIAVFLDGLDEIPARLHQDALRELSDQTCRLVLLTRTTELAAAAQQHILTGAVALELQPLTPADTITYLQGFLAKPAPGPWQNVFDYLTDHPTGPIAQALRSPLTVTLLRDIYPSTHRENSPVGEVDELLNTTRFPHAADITGHLLDHAITAAYTPRGGRRVRYSGETANRTLAVIAEHLQNAATRDLCWWSIPGWPPRAHRVLIDLLTTLVVGLLIGLAVGGSLIGLAAHGLVAGPGSKLGLGLVCGSVVGLLAGLITSIRDSGETELPSVLIRDLSSSNFTGSKLVRSLRVGLLCGLWFGLMYRLFFELVPSLWGALLFGLWFGLWFGLLIWLLTGTMDRFLSEPTDVVGPQQAWRLNSLFFLVAVPGSSLALGLWFGLSFGLANHQISPHGSGVVAALAAVALYMLAVGLIFGFVGWFSGSSAGRVWVFQIYLHFRWRTPLRLLQFLEDARSRHLLRTVGTAYQFRHATLQDRLAPIRAKGSLGKTL